MPPTPDAPRAAVPADYPFRPQYFQCPEGRVHYVDEGSGRADPIVFIHGTPTWSYEWRHLMTALSPRWRCIAPDLLGFGHSERPLNFPYTPEAHSAVIRRVVEGLGLTRFTLVVHDFGGPIALPLALDLPTRVARLVVINSWMWGFGDDRQMQRRARIAASPLGRALYRWINFSQRVLLPGAYGDRKKLTPGIHRAYLDRFPDRDSRELVLFALARALNGSRAYYDALWARRAQLHRIPTLILWGMKDSAFQPRMLGTWRSALPEARIVELADAGHWPHEEVPGLVTTALEEFLTSTPPGTTEPR